MSTERLSIAREMPARASTLVASAAHTLSQPHRQLQLRRLALFLLALWAVFALARLIWSLVPSEELALDQALVVINPVTARTSALPASQVDIQRMVSWHLFGETDGELVEAPPIESEEAGTNREGIEEGARETRLDLLLRGVVASTEDGLGHAIIEHRKQQAVYAVEDKLPVAGNVVLAKVMPRQVVLENAGTYELLVLFEDTTLDSQLAAAIPDQATTQDRSGPAELLRREDAQTTALASSFRDRLYQDPQSLADVVNVSAVRTDGELRGYRVSPGKQQQQFEQLGFRQGDLVTGINGIALDDPANTLQLYQAMRTAGEAVFDLERDGRTISLSVQLQKGAPP